MILVNDGKHCLCPVKWVKGEIMVHSATFNTIISWRSVLLVEESGGPGVKHRPVASHWVHLVWTGLELTTLVVIGTDCIGSCKSNYHMITTTTTHWGVKEIFYSCLVKHVKTGSSICHITLRLKACIITRNNIDFTKIKRNYFS